MPDTEPRVFAKVGGFQQNLRCTSSEGETCYDVGARSASQLCDIKLPTASKKSREMPECLCLHSCR